ncbi:MAG: N-acetylmuramoyl-L-alanine amidase, partial [Tuberibacillus sp.]
MKIAVDAGHGANTPGKRTPVFPDGDFMKEHEFNYATANYVVSLLNQYQGVSTLKTYEAVRDVPLKERTDKANAWKADVFVSIHANANGSTWNDAHGIETFVYITRSKASMALAAKVQSELVKATGLSNRGVKTANLHVLRETNMPAILTECGFMTNRKEAALLESDAFRRKCEQAIVTAIASQYGLKLKAVSKPNAQPKPQQPAKKEVLKVPGPFKDVPGDRWSAKAIENLKAKG